MRDPDGGDVMTEQRHDRDREESNTMASDSDKQSLEDYKRRYKVFMRLLGYCTVGVAVVLILLAIFLL